MIVGSLDHDVECLTLVQFTPNLICTIKFLVDPGLYVIADSTFAIRPIVGKDFFIILDVLYI